MQITNAQLDALRIENQSLRDGTGSPDSNTQDMRHAERQLQELKNMHKQHMKESQVLQVSTQVHLCSICTCSTWRIQHMKESQVQQVSTQVPVSSTWSIQRYCRLVLRFHYLVHGGYKGTAG